MVYVSESLLSPQWLRRALAGLVLFASLSHAFAEDGMEHEAYVEPMSREKTIYFPQFQPVQTVDNEAYMMFSITGRLALSNECLRLTFGGRSYLLIWPGWYTFDIEKRDILISHVRTGASVARLRLGDTLSLSGGELEERPFILKYSIPEQCAGPYWAVGDIESVQTTRIPYNTQHYTVKPQNKPGITPYRPGVTTERHFKGGRKPLGTANQWLEKLVKPNKPDNSPVVKETPALPPEPIKPEPVKKVEPQKPAVETNEGGGDGVDVDDKQLEKTMIK